MTLAVTPGSGQTIKVHDDIVGTAGTPNSNVLSVQGVSGGTALPVSAAALPLPTGAATETSLASVKTAAETIAGAVSASKMAVSAAALPLPTGAATEASLATLAGAVASGKVKTTTADGDDAALGAKADAAATTDAGTFSLIALVKRLLGFISGLLAGTSSIVVKSTAAVVAQELVRPSDTTNYAANDVVGFTAGATVGVLADAFSENGASGYITKVELMVDQVADVLPYRVFFFSTAPTAIADNAPFTITYADLDKMIGYVDIANLGVEGSGGTGAYGFWNGPPILAKAKSDGNDLYWVLVIKSAQTTPPSAKKYKLQVTVDKNGV
jgi:hypothetical protein